MTPGLKLTTILYAGGLAVVSAAMLSLLPALKVTRARVQSHLANLGSRRRHAALRARLDRRDDRAGGADGHGHPGRHGEREPGDAQAEHPRRNFQAESISPLASMLDRPFEEETAPAFEARRARTFAELERRIAQEPGVVAVTFADRAPGSGPRARSAEVEARPAPGRRTKIGFGRRRWAPGFFEAFDRPIVAGRAFHEGDRSPDARTVIVNEAFARAFSRDAGSGSPIGARLRYSASTRRRAAASDRVEPADKWFEIVGVVRDFGLDPDDEGNEQAYVFHAASAGTVSPLVMSVRVRGNPATLAARLPVIAADVDAGLLVQDAQPLDEWVRQRDMRLDRDGRSVGGGDCARLVSVGAGHLLADVRQRLAADARNRAARGAGRQPAPSARRHPVPRHGAHGERHRSRRRPSAVGRRSRRRTDRSTRGRRGAIRRVAWR